MAGGWELNSNEDSQGKTVKIITTMVAAMLLVVSSAADAANATGYSFTILTHPYASAAGGETYVFGINNNGDVVGDYRQAANGSSHAFLYSNGTYSDVILAGATAIWAYGVNDSGDVVGYYTDMSGTHGFVAERSFNVTTLDVPGSTCGTEAYGINNAGQVVGYYCDLSGPQGSSRQRGFLLDHGTFTSIDMPGFLCTQPQGISNTGEIVGSYCDGVSDSGFRYKDGTYTKVVNPNSHAFTSLWGINIRGAMTGIFIPTPTSTYEGFVTYNGRGFFAINPPGADLSAQSIANGINDVGQIVGYFRDSTITNATVVRGYIAKDATAPTAKPTLSPKANTAGWNKTNVTINWKWTDNTSGTGIDPTNCTTTTPVSSEGVQTLTATCKDLAGNSRSASLKVKVDKTPPTCTANATPNILMPANHKMISVSTTVKINDALSGPKTFQLVSVTSSQAGSGLGVGDLPKDTQGWTIGTADKAGMLRAERYGGSRAYTISYWGFDMADNFATCARTVTVP